MKISDIYENENINDMTEDEQIKTITRDSNQFHLIENPSKRVQLAAVKHDAYLIRYIKNPSKAVQIAAVEKNPEIIDQYILNPCKEAILIADELLSSNRFDLGHDKPLYKSKLNDITSENEQISLIHDSPNNIYHFFNPSIKVINAALSVRLDNPKYNFNAVGAWDIIEYFLKINKSILMNDMGFKKIINDHKDIFIEDLLRSVNGNTMSILNRSNLSRDDIPQIIKKLNILVSIGMKWKEIDIIFDAIFDN